MPIPIRTDHRLFTPVALAVSLAVGAALAGPLGVLDLADIVGFVEAFNAGCP